MGKAELMGERDGGIVVDASTRSCSIAVGTMESEKHPYRKLLWAAGGFICFGLGVLGAFLPIIPTTPFLLAAAFFFARSSEKLNSWFKETRLYRSVLDGYVSKRAMSVKAKLSILIPVTLLLGLSFVLMAHVPIGRGIVAVIWVAHILYFGFIVKTEKS